MTEESRTVPLPPRPTGEGQGEARAAVNVTDRDLWLMRRRALMQEVKAIEQYLGIDRKPERLPAQRDVVK